MVLFSKEKCLVMNESGKKLISVVRTQKVEFEFFNFFDRSRGTLDRSKERKSEFFFSKCFHMYKEQCNV